MLRFILKYSLIFLVCTCVVDPALGALIGRPYRRAVSGIKHSLQTVLRRIDHRRPSYPVWRRDSRLEIPARLDRDRARRQVVAQARALLDTPYVHGGASAAQVDCSGLVKLVYARLGIHLPHSARLLFKLGQRLPPTRLQPGDLVFFHNKSGPASHVGIYTDQGRVIHASSSRRRVVEDPLTTVSRHNGYTGAVNLLGK